MKISFTDAAKNCDKAQDTLDSLINKRDEAIGKIHEKYNPDIFTAENDLRSAKKILQKMVNPPVVKKTAARPAVRSNKED